MKTAIGIVAAILLWASAAAAQDATPRQQEILMTAINADGWLTEQMHREFWAAVPQRLRSDPKEIAVMTSAMERGAFVAVRFQREAWESMRRSLTARRVVKTPEYEQAKAAMLASSPLPQYRQPAEAGARNAEAMIEAAATGRPMVSQKGTFYVTEEIVYRVLTGLDGSIHRFRRLMNPTWSAKVEERAFPDVHVRILWDGPFRKETEDMKVEGGIPARLTLLSHQISDRDYVQIGFVRMQGRWADPEGAAMRVVSSSLKSMGVNGARPAASRWRGRVAADGGGTASTSEGQIHASIRVVEAADYGGFWQIMGISASSPIDAVGLRERLEQAVQIDGNP